MRRQKRFHIIEISLYFKVTIIIGGWFMKIRLRKLLQLSKDVEHETEWFLHLYHHL